MPGQAKIRLVPGFRVSYAGEKVTITLKPTQNAQNATVQENQAMGYHVHVAGAKGLTDRVKFQNLAATGSMKQVLR